MRSSTNAKSKEAIMEKIEDAEGIILAAITPLDVFSKFLQDHPIGDAPMCAASMGDLLRPYVEALIAKHEEAFELLRGLTASGDGAM